MRNRNTLALVALLCALALSSFLAVAQQGRQVNDEALLDAGRSGEEWVSYNVNWYEQRYSPLRQINAANVGKLGLAWEMEIPRAATGNPQTRHEATPLVHNGVVYSIAPWSVVYAADARTGKELWRSDPEVDQTIWQSRICCGVVNRGIALYEGKVIAPIVDGRLRALDAATGRVVWTSRVSPDNMAYTITMAPRIIKGGKVIVGLSGGEYGVRGFFDAFDVNTGERAWRFYTVPTRPDAPGEAEVISKQPVLKEWAKSWSPDFFKLGIEGGGPVWNGFAYDPEADIVYVGTGQPATWTSYNRGEGDALCTNCIIAVRGATGQYIWHYQTTPGDDWDYDSIADIMLADLPVNGKTRKLLMHAPKNGFFYVLDRRTGELISAEPWVTVSWASGIDMRTGRPVVNPEARYATESVNVMPGPGGGHVWPPMSFHPGTGLVYIPSTIGTGYNYQANPNFEAVPIVLDGKSKAGFNMGTGRGKAGGNQGKGAPKGGVAPGLDPGVAAAIGDGKGKGGPAGAAAAKGTGGGPAATKGPTIPTIGPTGRGNYLVAWDPLTQSERWRVQGGSAGFNAGGTLATGGNLVFSSVNNRLFAFRADTGEQLLELPTGLAQMGPPMTFLLEGKQYIVVAGGPAQAGGGFGGGGGAGKGGDGKGGDGKGKGAPQPPAAPSRMLALVVDGTVPLPGVPPAADNAKGKQ